MDHLIQQLTNIAGIIIMIWTLILGPTTIPKLLSPLLKGIKQYITSHLRTPLKSSTQVQKYEEIIIFLRNVFSLLPLIATWYGLYDAVGSYQKYLQSKPHGSSQPFLALWQGGFGGISHFTFGQIALLDTIMLVVFLVLSLLSLLLGNRRWLEEERQHKEEEKQRTDDLIKKIKEAIQEDSLGSIDPSKVQTKENSVANINAEQLAKEISSALKETFKEFMRDIHRATLEANSTSEKRNEELYLQIKELFNLQLQMTRNVNDELVSLCAKLENASQTSSKISTESAQTGKVLATDTNKPLESASEQFGPQDEKELAADEVRA